MSYAFKLRCFLIACGFMLGGILGSCTERLYCTGFAYSFEKVTVHEKVLDSASGEMFDNTRDSVVRHPGACVEWMEGRR